MRQTHRNHQRALLIVATLLVPICLLGSEALLGGALLGEVHQAYASTILATGKEPAFLLTLAFLITLVIVLLITYSIHYTRFGAFHDVTTKSGLHIHHMIPGSVLTLARRYAGLELTRFGGWL